MFIAKKMTKKSKKAGAEKTTTIIHSLIKNSCFKFGERKKCAISFKNILRDER